MDIAEAVGAATRVAPHIVAPVCPPSPIIACPVPPPVHHVGVGEVLHYAILAIVAMIVLGVALVMYRQYLAASGSTWQRVLAAAKGSATILWARFVAVIAALSALAGDAATSLGDPSVAQAIQTYFTPKVAAAVIVGVMLVTEIARKRSLPPQA